MKQEVIAVIMAAGKGTRMKSAMPKVLHPVAGIPMIAYPVQAALDAGAAHVVVITGHGRHEVETYLHQRFGKQVACTVQEEQRGTGHAVQCALPSVIEKQKELAHENRTVRHVLILSGDTPRVTHGTLQRLISHANESEELSHLTMATAIVPDSTGYGRIIRKNGQVIVAVREHKDCTEEERTILEINPALYLFDIEFLAENLPLIKPNNAQGELYLTDLITEAAKNTCVKSILIHAEEAEGINDRRQLSILEKAMLREIAISHQLAGVTIRDVDHVEIHATVTIGTDTVIERNVVLRGQTAIGSQCHIDVGSVLNNTIVGHGVSVKPYSVVTDSQIGNRAQIGPFSHLRPASDIGEEAHIGNFVEVKKTSVGKKSKANHLAYLGDGILGENVNVGAGTIFCNYDGFRKSVTVLDDGSFIGSDSQLVAPVRVGKGAYVATGTTVTRDVPDGALAIARTKQENKEGYAERLRARLSAQAKAGTEKKQ